MSFTVSPAVAVREIDLSLSVGEEVSSLGAFAGKFGWGPIGEAVLVSDETDLVDRFGKPTNDTFVDFFSVANFLNYTNGANVVRVSTDGQLNASTASTAFLVKNTDDAEAKQALIDGAAFTAKFAGDRGNSIVAHVCTSAEQFSLDVTTFATFTGERSRKLSYVVNGSEDPLEEYLSVGDFLIIAGSRYQVLAHDIAETTITLDKIYIGPLSITDAVREWQFAGVFGNIAPAAGNVHVVLVDEGGLFTGEKGALLEDPYANLSLSESAVDEFGNSTYVSNVINSTSAYVYSGKASAYPVSTITKASILPLVGGADDFGGVADDAYIDGYAIFANSESIDAPLVISGEAIKGEPGDLNSVIANYIIDSVVGARRDGVAFISPSKDAVVNNRGNEANAVIECRQALGSTSYALMDSGWKYQYDKYNNTFRWVPLNGDHAGIYARNDRNSEVWKSGAGTSNGLVSGVVKLAWSPGQVQRDQLYVNDVNPIVNMPVAGPTVMGDKTLLGKNSAFSRINTRRLFITIEKAIASAAAELLFEFNDEFTQRKFISMVEPFLRDIKGRRGIEDFAVIADGTVNTPQVIQNNRFVGQIFIKPKYSINFIRLDFVAVNASASFDEVIGSV